MIEFLSHCSKFINITLEDVAVLHQLLPTKSLSKNAFILKNESHIKSFYFIENGKVFIESKWSDQTENQIINKGSFISTYQYKRVEKQHFTIQSIEDLIYVELSLENLLKLFEYHEKFKILPSLMLQKDIVEKYDLEFYTG